MALGIFDYVSNPVDLLRTMARTARHVIASFPRPGVRMCARKVRDGAHGVSVYGYTRERIDAVMEQSGLRVEKLVPLGRAGFVLLARPGS